MTAAATATAVAMLEGAGFADVREHRIPGDLLHAVVTARKG